MSRSARLEELGLPFHVIAQGIEHCAIFRDDYDRTGFILRAIRIFREMGIEVLAWALMDNHVHFVLRATEGKLSTAMQRVLGPYAQGFNRRHGRVGRLFRDRFWSRPVEDDDDLLGLIGYVTLNPLRGGIVNDLNELRTYAWTSLSEILSPPTRREALVSRDDVLFLFGPDDVSAVDALLELLARQHAEDPDGLAFSRDEPGGASSLSSRERKDLRTASLHALRLRGDRIDNVLRGREAASAIRLRLERRGWTLERIVARAAEVCGASLHHLRLGARRHHQSQARSLVAHFAHLYLGCSDADIARATGVSRTSITRARARLAESGRDCGISWRAFFGLPRDPDEASEAKRL